MTFASFRMNINEFPSQKRPDFREIKEIKELRGGVSQYVAQGIAQIDTDIVNLGI